MLYASDLVRLSDPGVFGIEQNFDDLPDLIAELLCRVVEQRLKRNLSSSYRLRNEVLTRVRGHINALKTMAGCLLERGQVACRFDALTINTPRNRLVRHSLETVSRIVRRPDLGHRCWSLATDLALLGVAQGKPSRAEMSVDRIGRHDEMKMPEQSRFLRPNARSRGCAGYTRKQWPAFMTSCLRTRRTAGLCVPARP